MTNAFLLSRSAGENLAAFLRLRGRKVIPAAGVYWTDFEAKSRYLMSFPDHAIPTRTSEIPSLLRNEGALAARYPSPHGQGIPSGLYLYRRRSYSLSDVHRQTRNGVRRGLDNCVIRPVTPDELRTQGLDLNRDTLSRQNRTSAEFGEKPGWYRLVDAVEACRPFVSATGAFVEGRLAAYIIGCKDGGWMHLLYQYSRASLLPLHPNHALAYSVIAQALEDPTIEMISNGPKVLFQEDGLHQFKTRLGYEVEPMEVAIQFHPWASPMLVNRTAVNVAAKLGQQWPAHAGVAKSAQILDAAYRTKMAYSLPASVVRRQGKVCYSQHA
ncbi:MAG: GNAT family N-acetyltransferase [Acidobacteria bacterium]|nr:GNAT family N-acetyltransferase [Acidobacteriota bacterium]